MIRESTVLAVVTILLGIIDLLLFFIYALLRERVLRRWGGTDGRLGGSGNSTGAASS